RGAGGGSRLAARQCFAARKVREQLDPSCEPGECSIEQSEASFERGECSREQFDPSCEPGECSIEQSEASFERAECLREQSDRSRRACEHSRDRFDPRRSESGGRPTCKRLRFFPASPFFVAAPAARWRFSSVVF